MSKIIQPKLRTNISKSDTIHQTYSNHKIKQQLLDYVYTVIDISKYKYKLLQTKDDLQLITMTKYYISGSYSGQNCLMVFTKNKDRFYSFVIERQTLKYDKTQINIDAVEMYPIEVGLEETIYNGTIMDGILYDNNGKRTFIITDVYLFRGIKMINERINYKLMNIKMYFDTYIDSNSPLNNISILVNNLYEMSDIRTLVEKVIPHTNDISQTTNGCIPVRGIAFFPIISGTRLIYLMNIPQNTKQSISKVIPNEVKCVKQITRNCNPDVKYHKNISHHNISSLSESYNEHSETDISGRHIQQKETKEKTISQPSLCSGQPSLHSGSEINISDKRMICKTDKEIIVTFEIKRTEQPDVYKLFLVSMDTDKKLRKKSFGIAYIPTAECSLLCNTITQSHGRALVRCTYDRVHEKWIPFEQEQCKKCPDDISTLNGKIEIIV